MSLQNFIKNLQEQDDKDTVYSPEVSQNVKVIPPENASIEVISDNTKVIPPEPEKPKKISTLKLNLSVQKPVEVTKEETVEKEVVEEKVVKPVVEKPKEVKEVKEITAEDLFIKSGTDYEFKDKWLSTYEKAQSSKKQNAVADRLRQGRFIATKDAIIILPDYDTTGKSAEDMLEEQWI